MRARADLHTHSSASDGSDYPSELARRADDLGLGAIALTDHDSLDGIKEFMEADVSEELIRVPGLEISSEHEQNEVHILGYFVPLDSKRLNEKLEHLRKSRHERLPKMIQKLRNLGIDVTTEELYEELDGVSSPGRPHVAKLLVEKGVVKSTMEAFQKYLASDRPAYVKKERMQAIESIRLLKTIGAVPVVAHPLTIRVADLRELMERFVSEGLVGVEVEYDYGFMGMNRSPDEVRKIIQGLGVIQTGGSDYHGTFHFTELGSTTVPIDVVDEIQRSAKK